MAGDVRALRRRLAAGEAVVGTFCAFPVPHVVEIVGAAGFDFVILDMEHGAISAGDLPNALRAADANGLMAFVRIPSASADLIAVAIDAGAAGIIVPAVESAAEAAAMIALTRFPPKGRRGVHNATRALRYSARPLAEAMADEARPITVLQIETAMSSSEARAIARTDGLDVLFVGVYDLSTSLGLAGQFAHPDVVGAVDAIVAEARAAGVSLGIWAPDAAALPALRTRGFSFLTVSNTEKMMFERSHAIASDCRRAVTAMAA